MIDKFECEFVDASAKLEIVMCDVFHQLLVFILLKAPDFGLWRKSDLLKPIPLVFADSVK